MMLARNINIDTEELNEKIIDGIPASGLRDQARIQCFSDLKQILRAFSEIRLPQRKQYATPVSADAAANKGLRCANCNSRGHFAKDCFKPKREPGSCYACGAFGHLFGQCPERRSVSNNNYVRYCKIFLCNKIVTLLIAACLIDSGSPISFVKKSLISTKTILEPVSESYFGLNRSQLKTFGKMLCYVLKGEIKYFFHLNMVSNESMSHGVVLGRNFMNACAQSLDLITLKMVTLDAVNENVNNQLSNNSAIPIESDKLQIKTMGKRMSIGKNEKFNDNTNKIVRDEVIKEAKIDEIVSDTVSKEIDKIVSDTVSKKNG
ncbi:uncharacterized protein LOC117186697 [Drosophila miranda]|uniref:uncharacterized protein LOC117186697 n=1 Tax=Drosophila miranda TaxID=7229 RepID=UPI00143F7EBC|nr:uncharacterized protein LOC117186697 [Drosophila miranda]